MDLLEYQGKELLAKFDVPVPQGGAALSPQDAQRVANEVGFPCAVKAQVQTGGRGKAGGIKVAANSDEAFEHAKAILGMDIKGHSVNEVWIERAENIEREYYAAAVFDRASKSVLMMLSSMGGMDVEEIADSNPEAIARLQVDPLVGFLPYQGRKLAFDAKIDADVIKPVGKVLATLYRAFIESDAMLVEINPLVVNAQRQVIALDAKITIDDNALYRQPFIAEMRQASDEDPQEQMARDKGLTYVKLDGSIGILGNGAGLVMSTLDVVAQAGGKAANFLDVGGGAKAEEIVDALEVIISDEKVTAILFNIFGGITRCDEVARGILTALSDMDIDLPIVVRLDGTNDEEGRSLLADRSPPGLHVEKTMLGAAERAVELAV